MMKIMEIMKWELEIIWENKEKQKDPSIIKKLKVEKPVFHVENMKLMIVSSKGVNQLLPEAVLRGCRP